MPFPVTFNTPLLNDYLSMVEDTESPRIYHVWGAIFAVAATLGRRCSIPFGAGSVLANQYVLLVGAPGTRKSTAANMSRKLLARTGVRFAPSDTGFQRQGLAEALLGNRNDVDKRDPVDQAILADLASGMLQLTMGHDSTAAEAAEDLEEARAVSQLDKHALTIVASEFSRVIGQNNLAMIDFLGERWDGEPYHYRTRQSDIKMPHTLINMMACSTPVSIANSLPAAAGGQGFLSRIILVYGARKYKRVPFPPALDSDLVARVSQVVEHAYFSLSGEFQLSTPARAYAEHLYDFTVDITDSRFEYYKDRRFQHLLKVAMVLAAARGSQDIQHDDVDEAHRILRATERGMPDALGEFGLNPLAMLKQEIIEQLRATQGPMRMQEIIAMFHRDARSSDIAEVINDLMRAKAIVGSTLPSGDVLLSAKATVKDTEGEMLRLLSEG